MIGAASLLREHAAEVDADFLSHYGIDVRRVGSAALPWGRFIALVQRLPVHSHTMTALRGESDQLPWSPEMHLAASLLESQQATNYLLGALLQAHGADSNPVPQPQPIPRPGVSKPPGAGRGLASLIERLGGSGRIR
ncbi:hypothetical protein [Kutzneria chonburiensis]|uniref:Uncharacterized protein n=1 Tax=Kutzneria chonburiensis TaxID=1483604 RepID=A0ABV6N375_9PSEU|nr:hypothetical protein [Kutzneria chonburiensis]